MSKGKVVVICGSRSWTDHKIIRDVLKSLPAGTIIRTGGAKGADLIAEHHARRLKLEVEPSFKPDYERYGRYQAPKERNTEMLEALPLPVKVIAFWDGISGGTLDTIQKAIDRKIPVEIYATKKVNFNHEGKGDVDVKVNT